MDPPTTASPVPTFGRYAVLIAGALNLGSGLAMPVTFSVMFPEWQETFNASRAVTAAVHSTSVGILYGGGVVAGCMVKRFGYRASFFIGSFMAALGMLLGAFATGIPFLWASVGVLSGCGFCLIQVPCIPSVTRVFQTRLAVAIATVTTIGSLVILVMPSLYNLLIQLYSWRGAFIIISGMSLNTVVLAMIMTSYVSPRADNSQICNAEVMELLTNDSNKASEVMDSQASGLHYSPQKMPEKSHTAVNSWQDSDTQKPEAPIEYDNEEQFTALLEKGKEEEVSLEECSIEKVSKPTSNIKKEEHSSKTPQKNDMSLEDQQANPFPIFQQTTERAVGENSNQKNSEQCSLLDPPHSSNHGISKETTRTTFDEENTFTHSNYNQRDIDEEHASKTFSRTEAIRNSAWKFLLDPLALAIYTQLGLVLSPHFSAQLLAMDIAANKGAPQHGLLLVMAFAIAASTGKALAGIFGLWQRLPSFLVVGASGIVGSVSLAALGFVSSLPAILTSIGFLGVSMGLTISAFPKCFLDLACMDEASYPLALGLGNSIQGVVNLLSPILVGHIVDVRGTYALPFSILSAISLLFTCLFLLVYKLTRHKAVKS